MKKWIGFALCAVLVLTAPVVQGATVYTEGFFEYRVQDGGVVICGYFGRESVVTVPDSIAGYPVSVIGSGAFSDCGQVSRINLPGTIMTIEEGAIGQEQTVVYENGTGGTTEREPLPTPTAAPSTGGDRYDEDAYVPQVPVETQQPTLAPVPSATPEATATPAPSASPEVSATPVASVTPAPSASPEMAVTPDSSAAPEVTETPVPSAAPEATAEQPTETEAVTETAETQPMEEDKPDKLTVRPVEKKSESGWFLIALGAAAGCAAVLIAVMRMRKRNGK